MTHLELLTIRRDLLQGQKIPDSLIPILKLTPTQILEDVINIWYHRKHHKLLFHKLHCEKYSKSILQSIIPKTDDPDEFWSIINPLLKQSIEGKMAQEADDQ